MSTGETPSQPTADDGTHAAKAVTRASAWSDSADAYTANLEERTDDSVPYLGMVVGRKLVVTRVASVLAGKDSPVVLDVAAAGGEPAISMAKEIPHATVHGTDFAPGMVEVIRKRGEAAGVSNLKASVEDGQLLAGFEDGSVDVVTCTWGLESMPDCGKAIEQFYRVVKPGGMALFAAWDKDPNSIALKMFRVISTLKQGDGPELDIQPLGGDAGMKAMEDAGFASVTASQVLIPFYVPPGFGLRDIFPYMVNPTPVNGVFTAMEKEGRVNVREEAATIFESQTLEDMARGQAPTGPGLPDANHAGGPVEPSFYMKAILVEGHKTG